MNEKVQLLIVHAGCVLIICLCFGLAELTELRTVMILGAPLFSRALECAGFLLWGKLGFKPAEVILARILASMPTEQVVKALSQRPPAAVQAVVRSLAPPPVGPVISIVNDAPEEPEKPPSAGGA